MSASAVWADSCQSELMDQHNYRLNIKLTDDIDAANRQRRLDKAVAAQSALYVSAKDYANFIIVAGYAAFFALWGAVVKDLQVLPRLASGGLIGLSLIMFIVWELYGVLIGKTPPAV